MSGTGAPNSDPTALHPLARPSSRTTVIQLVVRLVFTVVFPLLQPQPSLRWVLILLYVVGCATVAFVFTWQLPYYRFGYNELRCVEYWMLTWVGLCLALIQIINDAAQSGLTIMMFLCLPMIAALALMTVRWRRRRIKKTPVLELASAEEVELKVRFLLDDYAAFQRQKNMWREGLGTSFMGGGAAFSSASSAASASSVAAFGDGENDTENDDRFAPALNQAEQWLNTACRRFPTSTMFLLRAQFYFFCTRILNFAAPVALILFQSYSFIFKGFRVLRAVFVLYQTCRATRWSAYRR